MCKETRSILIYNLKYNIIYNKILQKIHQNLYYGSGIIANYDKYLDHKKSLSAKYPKKKFKSEDIIAKHQQQINNNLSDDIIVCYNWLNLVNIII